MDSNLVAGTFSLLGTAVAGLLALLAALLHARREKHRERTAALRDFNGKQRDQCSKLLTSAEAFLDSARELSGQLDTQTDGGKPEAAYAEYCEQWTRLTERRAAVQLFSPAPVAEAASKLMSSIADHSNIIDSRYRGSRWPRGYDESREAARQAKEEFVQAVRKASTELLESPSV